MLQLQQDRQRKTEKISSAQNDLGTLQELIVKSREADMEIRATQSTNTCEKA